MMTVCEKLIDFIVYCRLCFLWCGSGNLHRTRLGLRGYRGIGRRERDPATRRREHERRVGSLTFSVIADGPIRNPCTARGLVMTSVRRRHRPVRVWNMDLDGFFSFGIGLARTHF